MRIPLARLCAVTGVSGSGKSTLARDVLHDNLVQLVSSERRKRTPQLHGCREIKGWEQIGRVLEVDQTPIGKTPRSCPATYVGFWDAIRKMFAETSEARMRGYEPGPLLVQHHGRALRVVRRSGHADHRDELPAGREGRVRCVPRPALLARDAGGALQRQEHRRRAAMSVDEATEFFSAHRSIHHCLTLLQDVGLGYLTLGQQSPTLSGGEAQRIKLVTELAKVSATHDRARSAGRASRHALTQRSTSSTSPPSGCTWPTSRS